ncbi:hypothetical protein [Flammeovirga sp. OC4]|uniref:hypothetical protein n=1 Tax=Flammeovirga sp. OC4 TaxID=1382345 RepID=UPI0005C5DBC8|nr:hypothetical protein [Flammeovirga sp. OC4]
MNNSFYSRLLLKTLHRLSNVLRKNDGSVNGKSQSTEAILYKGLFHETKESLFVQNYIFYPDNTFKVEKYEMKFENDIPMNYEVVVDNGQYINQEDRYTNTILETGFSNYIREGNSYKNLRKGVINNKITEMVDFAKEKYSGIPWVNEYIDPIVFETRIKATVN